MITEAEQQLLHDARNGNCEEVRQLLETIDKGEVVVDINCKGRSKSNLGWTPLHLACYFGHGNVVKDLLKAGAEVNVLNDMGDTPLHRAAFTGRKEVVMLLLQYDADTSIVNGGGQTARDVTQDKEIKNMLEAVERTQERKLEELLLGAAREGETAKLSALLNRPKPPDINCTDQMGNTPLHCAAYRAHKHCALKLLKNGADSKIRNKNDQTPFDLAQGAEMKQILAGSIGKVINKRLKRYEGLLWKSLRFFGWKLYWVVLEHGVLSWYRKQADAINNDHRQGCKHLTQAVCTVKSTDSCLFSVKCFDDSVHSFKIPKNSAPKARENWLEAIEDHSAYSTHYCTQEQLSDEEDDDTVSVAELQETLQKAQTCQQRLDKEISNFLTMIKSCNTTKGMPPSFLQKIEVVSEVSKETCEALGNCLKLFTKQEGRPAGWCESRARALQDPAARARGTSKALASPLIWEEQLQQPVRRPGRGGDGRDCSYPCTLGDWPSAKVRRAALVAILPDRLVGPLGQKDKSSTGSLSLGEHLVKDASQPSRTFGRWNKAENQQPVDSMIPFSSCDSVFHSSAPCFTSVPHRLPQRSLSNQQKTLIVAWTGKAPTMVYQHNVEIVEICILDLLQLYHKLHFTETMNGMHDQLKSHLSQECVAQSYLEDRFYSYMCLLIGTKLAVQSDPHSLRVGQ
ncbi:MAGUK p55 subfamily member 7 [Platysternon megacephalum]|uniref:Oxysterol-binding protein-related protein 1 n=1 Tax=Platysternon megacephalum TaxID=55544 RepID=A0A4D9EP78_9SAUR|nr:MAGUK p55 subfamily member 7 [Platysternon megacephalum]